MRKEAQWLERIGDKLQALPSDWRDLQAQLEPEYGRLYDKASYGPDDEAFASRKTGGVAMNAEKTIGPKRKRVLDAINHRTPDRAPMDFGGSAITGIHVSCVAKLRDYYGLEKRPVKVCEPFQMLGLIEDDLREAIGIDVTPLTGRGTFFGFDNRDWKPWNFNGLEVLVPEGFRTTVEPEKGGTLIYPKGDLSAPPSGHMPKDGFFFDAIIRQKPHRPRPSEP